MAGIASSSGGAPVRSDSRIYVAGHAGLVGSALVRALRAAGHANLVVRTREQLDLTDQGAVERFFAAERPEIVLLAAAKVGGILANDSYPADFIRDNLLIQQNVICAAHRAGAAKLLFLGSSCIYPREAPQPMREDALLSGPLEPTNQWYAIAKIAGIKLCQAYRRQYGFGAISVMPTNLYGPNDNFHPMTSHVLPALLRRLHEAREAHSPEVVVWGTGAPRREFLHVDDLAEACLHLLRHYDGEDIVNIGTGVDLTIRELAGLIADVVGYRGELRFDPSRPDGAPRKLLDVSRMEALGWRARVPVRAGIEQTYRWYLDHPGARA
jgi:GDP-L-fucose synthase